jgi:hypothetical protein
LVDRHPLELIFSFVLEALRAWWAGLRRWNWGYLKEAFRVGMDFLRGLIQDCLRSGSPRRLIEDIEWASTKVSSRTFGYTGEVVLLLGEQDTVIRWRDVFPDCEQPSEIPECLQDFRRDHFPDASRVKVAVIEGNHLAPETEAFSFVRPGLGLLGQLDELVSGSAHSVPSA